MSHNATHTSIRAQEFFARMQESFLRASAKTGETRDFFFCIAGRVLRLSFAGGALIEPLTRTFAHLALMPQAHPDITVNVWEMNETGVNPPSPLWNSDAYLRRGEIQGYNDGASCTVYHPDGRILFVYDVERAVGYVAAFDHTILPMYERAASLRPILFAALAAFHVQYVHAAAVGLAGGGVLLAGKSHAGKSTTSLACLDSDLFFAGDDYCAVRVPSQPADTPHVYSLYSTAKGDAHTVAHLPFLERAIHLWDVGGSEKAIWFLHEQMPQKLIREFPLRAILIPRITGARETRVSHASSQAALLALAPSTISQLPNADARVFQRIAAIAKSVPAFHLELGTDMKQIPNAIRAVLETARTKT